MNTYPTYSQFTDSTSAEPAPVTNDGWLDPAIASRVHAYVEKLRQFLTAKRISVVIAAATVLTLAGVTVGIAAQQNTGAMDARAHPAVGYWQNVDSGSVKAFHPDGTVEFAGEFGGFSKTVACWSPERSLWLPQCLEAHPFTMDVVNGQLFIVNPRTGVYDGRWERVSQEIFWDTACQMERGWRAEARAKGWTLSPGEIVCPAGPMWNR
ncbi:MAG: hypothetical protein LBH13_09470 [Cellulomonadaceae bacterium]|jgi:hypothetical protein|nr:hypothetical protein [Cellulomonadaceae bacterium]